MSNPIVRFVKHPAVIGAATLGYMGYDYFKNKDQEELEEGKPEAQEKELSVQGSENDSEAPTAPNTDTDQTVDNDAAVHNDATDNTAIDNTVDDSTTAPVMQTQERARDPLQILLDSGGHGVSLQGDMVKDLQHALAMSDLGLWSMMLYHKDGEPRVVDGRAGSRTYAAVLAYAEDHQLDLRSMTMAGLIQHAKAYEDPENKRMLDSQPGSSARTSAEAGKNEWDNGHTADTFNTQVAAKNPEQHQADGSALDIHIAQAPGIHSKV